MSPRVQAQVIGLCCSVMHYGGKTGVTADRDQIEFRLFNSSSIFNITLREELFSLPKQKNSHAFLSWFHGASHLVKFLGEKLKATIPLKYLVSTMSLRKKAFIKVGKVANELCEGVLWRL